MVELVLKYVWEQEQEQDAMRDHNIHSLFVQLRPEPQCDVKTLYNQYCQQYKSAIDIGWQHHGAEVMAVDMANFEKALWWNEEAAKNIKYEMTPRGKSVSTGINWSSKHLWTVPETIPNFAIEMLRWAINRNSKNPSL